MPSATTLLTVTATNGGAILTWSSVAGANGYTIKYGTAAGVYTTEIDAGNVTTYTVTGLTNGTTYYFALVTRADKFFLHMDGADASTTFTDSIGLHTFTAVNSAQIDTAQSFAGGSSGLFSSSTKDQLTTPDSDDFHIASDDFEFQVYARYATILSFGGSVLMRIFVQESGGNVSLFQCQNSGAMGLGFAFSWTNFGGGSGAAAWAFPSLTANTWYKLKLQMIGTVVNLYINDVLQSHYQVYSVTRPIVNVADVLYIGGQTTNTYSHNGWLDEMRWSLISTDSNELSTTPDLVFQRPIDLIKTLKARDQFFVDSGVTYDTPIDIETITLNSANAAVVYAPSHGLVDNDTVILYCCGDFTGRYEADVYNSSLFILIDTLTEGPLNASTYEEYVSGGIFRKGISVLTGLSHLNDQEVAILADGVVQEHLTVSAGSITLTQPYGLIHVGLQYLSDLETLNIEVPSKTIQGHKVKIGNVTFRLIDSRGGHVGPDENTLYEAFTQENFDLDADSIELFTGDVRVPLGAGYENGGRLFYRQYDPLPVTIGAIFPEVALGGPSGGARG